MNDIESVMNCEMNKVLNYCTINKLSVNMKKTNFMLITGNRALKLSHLFIAQAFGKILL